jgi:hypothetical protein
MIDGNNLKDKKINDLKFFYNNNLFKDVETKNKISGIKKLVTFVEKSLNGSTISVTSSSIGNGSFRKHGNVKRSSAIVTDRNKLVS